MRLQESCVLGGFVDERRNLTLSLLNEAVSLAKPSFYLSKALT